jgi:hypothetical protein
MSDTNEDTPARGRPAGSIQTPKSLLRSDITSTIKLNTRIRSLIDTIITDLTKQTSNPETPVQARLNIIVSLSQALNASTKTIETVVKMLEDSPKAETQPEREESVEDILKGLK